MSIVLRERKLPSGKIQLLLDIYHKGRRKREALDLQLTGDRKSDKDVRDLAERIRAKRQLEVANEAEGFIPNSRKKTNVFVYAKSLYEIKSEQTQGTYRNAFLYLQELTGKDLTFEKLTPKLCEQYKNFLMQGKKTDAVRGLKKRNSAAAYYERFRIVVGRAVEDGIISQNPTKGLSIRLEEALPKYLTTEQLQNLAITPCGNEIVRNAFFFSCYTGLRYGDVANMTWGQIQGNGVNVTQLKTGASQKIDLNNAAKLILGKYSIQNHKASDKVFVFPRRSTVDKVLKHWAQKAGIEISLSFHKARHTFATQILTQTGDIYTISKMLGHKSLATTAIYARVIDEKKKQAIDLLPLVEGL